MPPRPDAPGVLKTLIKYTQGAQNILNVLYFLNQARTAWTTGDIGNALDALFAGLTGQVLPLLSSDLVCQSTEGIDLTSNMGNSVSQNVGTAGGILPATSPPLTQQTALRLSAVSPMRYRGGHPGWFIPGMVQENLAAGSQRTWDTAKAQAIENAWIATAALVETHGGYSFAGQPRWSWLSYSHDHVARPAPLVFQVTSVEHQPRVCTRRKRLGKVSPDEF